MLFQSPSLLALSAITFLSMASTSVASHAHLHRPVQVRHAKISHQEAAQRAAISRRQTAGTVEVLLNEIQVLQQETAAFRGWMQAWFNTTNPNDTPASISELKQEYQAYDSWLNAWFDSTVKKTAPTPSSLPTTVPISAPIGTGSSLPTSIAPLPSPLTPVSVSTDTTKPYSAAPIESSAASGSSSSSSASVSPTTTKGGVFVPASTDGGAPAPSVSITSTKSSVSASVAALSVVPSPSAIPKTQPSSPSSGGKFDPNAKDNVAVYYGQSGATGRTTLGALCKDTNVNIVVLAFLTTIDGPGGYPTTNFGAACKGTSPEMTAAGATGLLSCPALATDITTCQGLGKKVMLSIGGSEASTAFTSDADATKFATTLWDLFGAGTGAKTGLRPFGTVSVDGFDVGKFQPYSSLTPNPEIDRFSSDNENKKPGSYTTFVTALRKVMNADSSKQYFISGAPQCIRPDASIPLDAMLAMDFVFVQFYNNLPCNIGSAGFSDSLSAWSSDLASKGSKAKIYVGAPACSDCAGSGYLAPDAMTQAIKGALGKNLPNFGGVSLWDGAEALANGGYAGVVKSALG